MSQRSTLKQDIMLTQLLTGLVTAYEEIAVMQIQKIRKSVLHTRLFHFGLTQLFNNVKASHQSKVAKILKKKHQGSVQQAKKGVVLISTNQKLSGLITSAVFQQFLEFIDHNSHEIIITGRVGKDLLAKTRPDTHATYFEMPDNPTTSDLRALTKHLENYDVLVVFHGQFVNLVEQIPAVVDLAGSAADVDVKEFQKTHKEAEFFLFEPSLDKVVHFFNTQIFATIYKQLTHEAHLAQLGSRIKAMEKATHTIAGKLYNSTQMERQLIRRTNNNKQRERLAGISLWSNTPFL